MSVATRQALFARFVDDPDFERQLRTDPDAVAHAHDAPLDFVRWLAAIEPQRLTAFRNSRVHKDSIRAGRKPTRI